MPPPERHAFGEFVLDRRQHLLLRRSDATAVALTPKQFDALALLVDRAGELLDKNTLLNALWPDLVVEENNLSQLVSGLRRALGDDAQGSRYIQTVPRRGFRFVATVSPAAAADDGPVLSLPDRDTARRRWLIAAATVGPVLAAGSTWWVWSRSRPNVTAAPPTLAVLPFKLLGAEGRDDLLEVGMADSLIGQLSTVPGLVVRSVGSVRRFAGIEQDLMVTAQALDVAWIVDGSLQRRGARWRATARLLSAPAGVAAWSGSFEGPDADVFALQDQIATRVAAVLAPRLNAAVGSLPPAATLGGTRNPDAYQLYLAARQHAQGLRATGLRKSVELYNKAIEADPGYALAHAGLAETYRRLAFGADTPPLEAFEPAEIVARRALALTPGLAQAHAAIASVQFWRHYDWSNAEQAYRHALSLNQNVVEAHFALGLLLIALKRGEEGLLHLSTARQLDPMSLIANSMEATFLLGRGRRELAQLRLARAFEIDADFWPAHITQAYFHLADGQPEQALASARRAEALADGSSQATALAGAQLARMGRIDEARVVLQGMLALGRQRYVAPTSLAEVYVALGETALALDTLERAYSVRDARLVFVKVDGRWAALRGEPRFVALLKRMRLDA